MIQNYTKLSKCSGIVSKDNISFGRCTSNTWKSLSQWFSLFSCSLLSISESYTPSDVKQWGTSTFSLLKPLVHLGKICLKSCLLNILDLTKLTIWPALPKYPPISGQDTKYVKWSEGAVPHLPPRLHRRRLPLLPQPQVLPRLLQGAWCPCHRSCHSKQDDYGFFRWREPWGTLIAVGKGLVGSIKK